MSRTRLTSCNHCGTLTSCFKVDKEFFCPIDAARAKIALRIYLRELED